MTRVLSFFSGAGGLDLGFSRAGFCIVYANDKAPKCAATYSLNHKIPLEVKDIADVDISALPNAHGVIGGPPCQSWSLAGSMRGKDDPRGRAFWAYASIIEKTQPSFFLAENVPGILSTRHFSAFQGLIKAFIEAEYNVSYALLDAADFGIPQNRKRVFVVGTRKCLDRPFSFEGMDKSDAKTKTLRDALKGLPDPPIAGPKNHSCAPPINAHEVFQGSFSSKYMSRNRLREWDCPSYTIQASGRHAPLHPASSAMKKVGNDAFTFTGPVRRMSARECARVQTFPDDFHFSYTLLNDAYLMVGNAVPPLLAEKLGTALFAESLF